jgi:hypothetical protein
MNYLLSMELFQSKTAYINQIRLFDPDKLRDKPDMTKSLELRQLYSTPGAGNSKRTGETCRGKKSMASVLLLQI